MQEIYKNAWILPDLPSFGSYWEFSKIKLGMAKSTDSMALSRASLVSIVIRSSSEKNKKDG